jgi:two-component system, NtrC family, response regulator AtoC
LEEPTHTLTFGQTPEAPRFDLEERSSLLIFHREGARLVPLEVGRPVVVGRSPPVDVIIPDSSLSRQHARFELLLDEVFVNDLGSTNGTWVDGRRITREKLGSGVVATLGGVAVTVHMLKATDSPAYRLSSHDQFLSKLEEEMSRARAFSLVLSVVHVQAVEAERGHVSHWFTKLRRLLRAVDTLALFCPTALEILMPEMTLEGCLAALGRVRENLEAEAGPRLLFGFATYPGAAASAEELIHASRSALKLATPLVPIQALEPERTHSARREQAETEGVDSAVVLNPTMKELYKAAKRLAQTDVPVLIQGETGTGKELLAKVLHEHGKRRKKVMCSVNCAAIPGQLVESTLFGHERGAFTGADRSTGGLFEGADGGTILLDEIGELPLPGQGTLLRVLETGLLTRVGSTKERRVDVRIITATNRDLEEMCRAGHFRWDLYYRINVMTLKIPPLRERLDEIPALVDHFVRLSCRGKKEKPKWVDAAVIDALRAYAWPGNIRELRNTLERTVFVAQGETIACEDLPERFRVPQVRAERSTEKGWPVVPEGAGERGQAFKDRMEALEAEIIRNALAESGQVQTEAAKRIGMPLRTFVRKAKKYGLSR